MQKQEHVVFKRSTRSHDEPHHGGAWKVAMADFMIALMALFLVLWVMQVVNKEERKAIVAHLHSASVFDRSYGNPFDTSQSISPIDLASESSVPSKHDSNHTVTSFYNGNGNGSESDAIIPGNFDTQEQLTILAKVIEEMMRQISAQGNVHVSVTPQGLRIVLQDDYKQHMFSRGGTELTPFLKIFCWLWLRSFSGWKIRSSSAATPTPPRLSSVSAIGRTGSCRPTVPTLRARRWWPAACRNSACCRLPACRTEPCSTRKSRMAVKTAALSCLS